MEESKGGHERSSDQPSSDGGDKKVKQEDDDTVKIKQEYDEDTDDEGERKPSAKTYEMGTDVQVKQEEYTADTDDDAIKSPEEGEEEGEMLVPLKQFPKEHKNYVLHRAAGGDVLQVMEEHKIEGVLEIDAEGKSAKFWVKFPNDKGVIAGRIDHKGVIDGTPPTFFRAVASKAYIDYGMWQGPIYRDGDMPGARFFGTMMCMGTNVAVAGNEDFSATNPLHIDKYTLSN